jgi:hypothetical protein
MRSQTVWAATAEKPSPGVLITHVASSLFGSVIVEEVVFGSETVEEVVSFDSLEDVLPPQLARRVSPQTAKREKALRVMSKN